MCCADKRRRLPQKAGPGRAADAAARVGSGSEGKESPSTPGHNEGPWWKTRRPHFVITAKWGPTFLGPPRELMTHSILRVVVVAGLVVAAAPAAAANKEHQQLMADIRMLQEQAQQLQNILGALNESIKAVNARLDDQTNVSRKAFADQK